MNNQRQLNIELIRIFSMFLICLWHINGHVLPLLPKGMSLVDGIFARITPYISFHVDLFVLITGYFGIHHCARSVTKTCVLVFFYALVLGTIGQVFGIGNFHFSQLLPFTSNPWWFMKVYLMLLLVAPILECYIQDKKSHLLGLLIGTTFVNVYMGWFMQVPLYNHHGYDIFNFVNLYIIGRSLHGDGAITNKLRQKPVLLLGFFLLCCLIRYKVQPVTSFGWWDYSSPLNILMAVCIFCLFLRIRISARLYNPIRFLSVSAVAVYLITDYKGGYSLIASALSQIMANGTTPILQFVLIFIFVVVLFVLCCCLDKLRIMITRPIEEFCYNKLEKYVKKVGC